MRTALLILGSIAVVACRDGQATPSTSIDAKPGIVDSILSIPEALVRFNAGLPETSALQGGVPTLDELTQRFTDALAKSDTAALREMVITRSEYGYLYFPTSVYASKPYELAPDIAWMLSSESSEKGLRRMLRRLGGQSLAIEGAECEKKQPEGENEIFSDCHVSVRIAGAPAERRKLFQSVIRRGPVVKFLSYSGDS
jgi:hypothetical protein